MFKTILLATASAAILPVSPALAQQASQPAVAATNSPAGGGDVDGDSPAKAADRDQGQAIVVTGTRRPTADVLGGVSVLDADEMAHDLKPSLGDTLADMPGDKTWPIAGASFIVVPTKVNRAAANTALQFFDWAYRNGSKQAEELDYVTIPPTVANRVRAVWAATVGGGTPADYERK